MTHTTMRTEQDLRTAMSVLADLPAPDVDEARPIPARSPRGRGWVTVAVAAALVAALAVGTQLVHRSPIQPASTGGAVGPYRLPMSLPGWQLVAAATTDISPAVTLPPPAGAEPYGNTGIYRSGARLLEVTAFLPGSGNPRPVRASTVSVGSATGYFGVMPNPGYYGYSQAVGVAWRYRAGSWARIMYLSGPVLTRSEATSLARSVRWGVGTDIRVPFRLSAVPSNSVLAGLAVIYPDSGLRGHGHGWAAEADYALISSAGHGSRLQVNASAVADSAWGTKERHGRTRSLTVDGHDAWWYAPNRQLLIRFGQGFVEVDHFEPGHDPAALAQARSVAALVGLASQPDDPSTWFTAAAAVPR